MAFLNALFTAALDNNLVFAQLVGMVSVVLVAGRPQDSWCFGGMVAVATAVAGAFVSWTAIVVIATVLGAGKTVAERERLLRACPIIACNAAVLAVSLGNAAAAETLTWDAALGSSLGAGLGVLLAVVLFAFVRDRIDERLVPAALRGLPITLVTASLMALAFTGVAGIAGGLFV